MLTTAALGALDDARLAAVIAHERAHLREGHHLVLAATAALQRAFPRVRAFRDAHTEATRLVEMLADDLAAGAAIGSQSRPRWCGSPRRPPRPPRSGPAGPRRWPGPPPCRPGRIRWGRTVQGLPVTLVLDPDGAVAVRHIGQIDETTLRDALVAQP